MHKYFHFFTPNTHCALVALSEKKQLPFSMAIINVELMHECFLKHFRIEMARMKKDKEIEGKKRGMNT